MKEEAELELREARQILGSVAGKATFAVLVGCPQPPLVKWAAEREFGLVLLPCHRFSLGGRRFAKSLRLGTAAEVRLVA